MKKNHRKALTKREQRAAALSKARVPKKEQALQKEKSKTITIKIKTIEGRHTNFNSLAQCARMPVDTAEKKLEALNKRWGKIGIADSLSQLGIKIEKGVGGGGIPLAPRAIGMDEMGGGGAQTSRYGRKSGLGRRSQLSGYLTVAADDDDDDENAKEKDTQQEETEKEKKRPNKKKDPESRVKTDDRDLADMKRAYSIICGIEETRNEYSYRIILKMKASMAALKRMIDEYEKLEKIKKQKKT